DRAQVDAFAPRNLREHRDGSLERRFHCIGLIVSSVLTEGEAPFGERTARAPAVAVVVDAGNEPRNVVVSDDAIEVVWIHGRLLVQPTGHAELRGFSRERR